jgi:hypothetical protein
MDDEVKLLTPQKKWRTNITSTLVATSGPLYRLLNDLDLPSLSSTGRLAILDSTSGDGIKSFVSTSPVKSAILSTELLLDADVVSFDFRLGEAECILGRRLFELLLGFFI